MHTLKDLLPEPLSVADLIGIRHTLLAYQPFTSRQYGRGVRLRVADEAGAVHTVVTMSAVIVRQVLEIGAAVGVTTDNEWIVLDEPVSVAYARTASGAYQLV
jgi:hypothetical protein